LLLRWVLLWYMALHANGPYPTPSTRLQSPSPETPRWGSFFTGLAITFHVTLSCFSFIMIRAVKMKITLVTWEPVLPCEYSVCLQTGRPGDWGSISCGGKVDFSSSLCVQTDSRAHPPSCTMGTEVLSPGLKRGRGVTLTTHPHLVPRSWMSGGYTSSSACTSIGVLWDCFCFSTGNLKIFTKQSLYFLFAFNNVVD
jgi:hypothetical protein